MSNFVFIATSLDGYIADKNGDIDWLHEYPNPTNDDLGYFAFIRQIDALLMGRATFEKVASFDCDWPYEKPVFVISNSMSDVPQGYEDKIRLVAGDVENVISQINAEGYKNLYIDGGKTIQSCLQADVIDELIITTVPVLLGEGIPLFGKLSQRRHFKHVSSESFLDHLVTNKFIRIK